MSEAAKIISDIYVGNRQMRFAERQKIENEITTLRQLLERAEARVAEYQESITAFVAENERLQAELDQVEAVSPSAILRKQAEAAEALAKRLQEAADKADEGPDESDTACTLLIAK